MERITVGSQAFFESMDGFKSKDRDFLELVENPIGFEWRQEISLRGVDTFRYRKESPPIMVQRTLDSGAPLLIGKFLIPEVAEAIGATVEDILPLEQLLPKLDDEHKYVSVIFAAVKENNSFILTDEQRAAAFDAYKSARVDRRSSSARTHRLQAIPDAPESQPDNA